MRRAWPIGIGHLLVAVAATGAAAAQELSVALPPSSSPPLPPGAGDAGGVPEVREERDAGTGEPLLKLGGYLKSIYLGSRTVDGADRGYDLNLDRLRVKVDADVTSYATVHVEEDLELRLGSYLATDEFHATVHPATQEYLWNPKRRLASGDDHELSQRPFRAYARVSAGPVDATVGRQRIPLGTGRFWSTLDLLNPVNPLAVEREEYVGVDAARLEVRAGSLSKVLLVYAPAPGSERFRGVARLQTNVQETDVALTAGRFWGDTVVGLDFATQLGGAGVRGEAVWELPEIGRGHVKGVLGIDYAPTGKLTLSAEAYATSQSEADRRAAFTHNPQLVRLMPAGSRNAGLSAEYEITPVLRATAMALVNLEDGSAGFLPSLSYTFANDWLVAGGAQLFLGSERTEYGRGEALGYGQLQRFF